MARFLVEVVSLSTAKVTDQVTNKSYNCKLIWHKREKHGEWYKKFYVDMSKVPNRQMKDNWTFPWEAKFKEPTNPNCKKFIGVNPVGLKAESDLSGKASTSTPTEDMFESF